MTIHCLLILPLSVNILCSTNATHRAFEVLHVMVSIICHAQRCFISQESISRFNYKSCSPYSPKRTNFNPGLDLVFVILINVYNQIESRLDPLLRIRGLRPNEVESFPVLKIVTRVVTRVMTRLQLPQPHTLFIKPKLHNII